MKGSLTRSWEKNGYVQLEKEETSSSWQQQTRNSFKVEGQGSIQLENIEVCDNNKTRICDITDKKCQNNQNENKSSLLNKRYLGSKMLILNLLDNHCFVNNSA